MVDVHFTQLLSRYQCVRQVTTVRKWFPQPVFGYVLGRTFTKPCDTQEIDNHAGKLACSSSSKWAQTVTLKRRTAGQKETGHVSKKEDKGSETV